MKPSILMHPPRNRHWHPSAHIALGFILGAALTLSVTPLVEISVAHHEAASPTPAPIERKFPVIVSREGEPLIF